MPGRYRYRGSPRMRFQGALPGKVRWRRADALTRGAVSVTPGRGRPSVSEARPDVNVQCFNYAFSMAGSCFGVAASPSIGL